MEEGHPFRLIFIVGYGLLFPIVAYYRLKSQAAGDRLDRRQEGLFILVTLRPVGVLCMLGLIAYMVNPTWMAWSSMALPRWLRWAGVGLGIIAGSLLIWTLRSLGRNLTDTVVTRNSLRAAIKDEERNMTLRIGSKAPDFSAETTQGREVLQDPADRETVRDVGQDLERTSAAFAHERVRLKERGAAVP